MSPTEVPDDIKSLSKDERIRRAVLCLKDALLRKNPVSHLRSNNQISVAHFVHTIYYKSFIYSLIIFLCCIILWEPTSYTVNSFDRDYLYYFLIAESIIYFFLLIDFFLRLYAFSDIFFKRPWFNFQLIFTIVMGVDIIIAISFYPELTFRFSRFFRPFLLIYYFTPLRRIFESLLITIPTVWSIFLILLIVVCVYSVLGGVIFSGVYKDSNGDPDPYGNFDGFGSSFLVMFVLVTTENFPFIIWPAYEYSKFSLIYFISFIILVIFLLMSSFIAAVYTTYKDNIKLKVSEAVNKEWSSLCMAFQYMDMDNSGLLSANEWETLLLALDPKMHKAAATFYYQLMDIDCNGYIDLLEFLELGNMLLLKIKIKELRNNEKFYKIECCDCWLRSLNKLPREKIKNFVLHKYFELFILSCIAITILIFAFNSPELSYTTQLILQIFDTILLFVFFLEMVLKLIGMGLKFFEVIWNKIDFTLVISSIIMQILIYVLNVYESGSFILTFRLIRISRYSRVILTSRFIRVFRFLFVSKHARQLLKTYYYVFPFFSFLLLIIFIIMYLYAIIGML